MDFTVRNKSELTGTGYIEICRGKYTGKHWQDGSSFIEEQAFGITEGIILKYFPNFNHFEPNDIPKVTGLEISDEWDRASLHLLTSDSTEILSILNLEGEYGKFMFKEIQQNKVQITKMLSELAVLLRNYYDTNEWVCILGI